jgi:hypothetical protein
LPATTYEAKQLVCPLGLDVQKLHACPNDCILYRGDEYENLDAYPVCGALRYKIRRDDPEEVEGEHPRKRVSAKVRWYSPILACLKCLFSNKDHAKLMQWHKEERKCNIPDFFQNVINIQNCEFSKTFRGCALASSKNKHKFSLSRNHSDLTQHF